MSKANNSTENQSRARKEAGVPAKGCRYIFLGTALVLLLPVLYGVGGMALITLNWAWRDIPRHGEHLPTVVKYSEQATNYSYYNRLLNRVCEFDILENAFKEMFQRKFAAPGETAQTLLDVETLPDLPRKILRYNYVKPEHESCPHFAVQECDVDPTGKTDGSCFRAVSQGWFFERRDTDGGGIVILYDAENGRCYIHTNPH